MTAVGTQPILGDFKFNSKAGKQINSIIYASFGSVLFTSDSHKKILCNFLICNSGSIRCPKTLYIF
jgi:ABC-type polysaccharide/polyol phosphate transport system ATPase subunit